MTRARKPKTRPLGPLPAEGLVRIEDKLAGKTLTESLELINSQPPPIERFGKWLDGIEKYCNLVLTKKTTAPAVKIGATRCLSALKSVRCFYPRGLPVADLHWLCVAMDAAADLADEWRLLEVNVQLDKPVRADTTARLNRAKGPKVRQMQADAAKLTSYREWEISVASQLDTLSPAERLRKYCVAKQNLPDRTKRALYRMLKSGALAVQKK